MQMFPPRMKRPQRAALTHYRKVWEQIKEQMVYPFSTFHSHFSLSAAAAAAGGNSPFSPTKKESWLVHAVLHAGYTTFPQKRILRVCRGVKEKESRPRSNEGYWFRIEIYSKKFPPLSSPPSSPQLLTYYRLPSARLHHHHTFRRWKVSPMPLGKKRGGEGRKERLPPADVGSTT